MYITRGNFYIIYLAMKEKLSGYVEKEDGGQSGEESVVFGNSVKEKTRSTKDTEVKCSVKRLKKKV